MNKMEGIVTANEVAGLEFNEKDYWLVDKILPTEGVLLIAAPPKSCKTWIALHLADCVAMGKSFLGKYDTKQSPVLIVNEENGTKLLSRRLKSMNISSNNLFFLNFSGVKVDSEDDIHNLVDKIKEDHIGLVIFDNFIRVHNRDENSASEMRVIFDSLKPVLSTGASIIFTHHTRKEAFRGGADNSSYNSARGSSEISAFVNSMILIKKTKENDCVILKHELSRDDEVCDEMAVQIDMSANPISFNLLEGDTATKIKASKKEQEILAVVWGTETPMSVEEIRCHFNGMSEGLIRRILDRLEAGGQLRKIKQAHNKYLYVSPDHEA